MTPHPRPEHIPRYSPKEAARLVGVSPRRLGQWARYERVRSTSIGGGRAYSWMNLAEAIAGRLRLHESDRQPDAANTRDFGNERPMRAKMPPLLPLPPGYLEIGARYLSEGGWARRALGENVYQGGVSVRPEVMSGKPVVTGTRIPAVFVGRAAADGEGQELEREYGLSPHQVTETAVWWNWVRNYAP